MDRHPLAGVQAKLDRAQEHFDVLNDRIGSYLREHPYRFVGEEHTEGGYHHWAIFLEVRRFPPDEVWGPIIGDAVHNLRSALDHLAWKLALNEARLDTPRRIEFPIFLDDPADNPEARGALRKKLKCLRPETHALVDGAQPYKTGNTQHPLWLLQALWNTDKHRTLHTVGFLFGEPSDNPEAFGFESWSFGQFPTREGSEHRAPLANGRGLADQDLQGRMDAYERMAIDVSLGWTGLASGAFLDFREAPFFGLPVRQMLRRIRTYVEAEIIEPSQSFF